MISYVINLLRKDWPCCAYLDLSCCWPMWICVEFYLLMSYLFFISAFMLPNCITTLISSWPAVCKLCSLRTFIHSRRLSCVGDNDVLTWLCVVCCSFCMAESPSFSNSFYPQKLSAFLFAPCSCCGYVSFFWLYAICANVANLQIIAPEAVSEGLECNLFIPPAPWQTFPYHSLTKVILLTTALHRGTSAGNAGYAEMSVCGLGSGLAEESRLLIGVTMKCSLYSKGLGDCASDIQLVSRESFCYRDRFP